MLSTVDSNVACDYHLYLFISFESVCIIEKHVLVCSESRFRRVSHTAKPGGRNVETYEWKLSADSREVRVFRRDGFAALKLVTQKPAEVQPL